MQAQDELFSWCHVSPDVKQLLISAASNWNNTSESEKYINEALAKEPENIDVLIAAYRYFFYKNNYRQALKMSERVIEQIGKAESLPDDWQLLKPILIERAEETQIRLYLNAFASTSFMLARLGETEKAKLISSQVKEIDTKNQFSSGTIFDIITRPPEDEDD